MNYENKFLLATLCILLPLLGFAQTLGNRIYVASVSSAGSKEDGKNWDTAFSDLQHALKIAQYGDTLWVAQGTYRPTTTNDLSISFVIPIGVKIFGGFNGTEKSIDARNWKLFPTVLSGRIGGVNTNSRHVVYLSDPDSLNLIDGLVIESGNANTKSVSSLSSGGGVLVVNNKAKYGKVIIRNSLFRNNGGLTGGALAIVETQLNISTESILENCLFQQNNAQSYGGAIYVQTFDNASNILIDKCEFDRNRAENSGSTIFHGFAGNIKITNCDFVKNETKGSFSIRIESIKDSIQIEDCKFESEYLVSGGIIDILALGETQVGSKSIQFIDIKRNRFLNTLSPVDGGAFGLTTSSNNQIQLNIEDCLFEKTANSFGANGISIFKNTSNSNVLCFINRCIFSENKNLGKLRGIIDFNNGSGNSDGELKGVITNCIFRKNFGILFFSSQYKDGKTKLEILNSTFFDNYQGVIINENKEADSKIMTLIQNSIFYEPSSNGFNAIFHNMTQFNNQNFTINHNLFSVPSCKTTSDTLGCGIGNIFGQYPKFVDSSSASGLKLAPGSVAINAGRWHPELPAFDLAGQPRVQDCKVDLGAYESPSILPAKDSLSAKAQIRSTPINQSLGEIGVQQITGGSPPYRLLWENGDTVRTRRNLAAGTYTLTLSDQQGCFKNYSFVVPFTTGVRDRMAQGAISLAPNPVPTGQPIKLFYQDIEPGNWELQLLDLTGKQLRNSRINLSSQGEMPIQLDALPKGVYLLKVSKERQVFNHKFVIL